MMRHLLVRALRLVGATVAAVGWLVMSAVMLSLFVIAIAYIIARLVFNTPMIIWRAASIPKPPHQ